MEVKIYLVSVFFKRWPWGEILRVHSFFEAENEREACLLVELSFSERFKRKAFFVQALHVKANEYIRKHMGKWVWNIDERMLGRPTPTNYTTKERKDNEKV